VGRPLVIEETVSIAAPAGVVWAMVTDYESDHLWRPGIREMAPDPPGPPAVGTHVREVLQTGKRAFVTESTVASIGPGMTYRFSGAGTTGKVEGARTVEVIDASTSTFTYRVELTLAGSFRFLRPLVGMTMQKGLHADLDRLRDLLEGSNRATGDAATP